MIKTELTKAEALGQLDLFGVKANKKMKAKAAVSLVVHELKIRLKERNVELTGKENSVELMELWVKNQDAKPAVAKSDRIDIEVEDKKEEHAPAPEKEEDS